MIGRRRKFVAECVVQIVPINLQGRKNNHPGPHDRSEPMDGRTEQTQGSFLMQSSGQESAELRTPHGHLLSFETSRRSALNMSMFGL